MGKWITATRPDEPVATVAVRSLDARLRQVWHYLPLAACQAQQDVEYVHQARVSARRAVAAVELYRGFLPKKRTRWMLKTLKRIRQSAGEARDCDVFAERISREKDPAAKKLTKLIRKNRRRAQQPIIQVYKQASIADKLPRRMEALLERVRPRGEDAQGRPPEFGPWARGRLKQVSDEFFNAARGDFSDYEILHEFRIHGKQLRYVMELLVGAFPPDFRRELYSQVEELQERLGRLNDHVSALDRLEHWMHQLHEDPQETAFLSGMADCEREQIEPCREEFLQWWTPQREQQLRDAMSAMIAGDG